MNLSKEIAVIGGGAAGFMAAITAKEINPEASVTIFEKTDKVLIKVKVSGGGRCNVTNATFSISQLIKNYPRGGRELKKSFNHFFTTDTVNWFESRGVSLKTEADNRMFPSSNNSQTIIDLLLNTVENLAIRISYKSKVNAINHNENEINLSINGETLAFDKVIIASGGSSKESGLDWLKKLGYKIISPVPSLFTFNMPKNPITELMGLSVINVITSIKGSKFKQTGPLLITHWGMSGPAILKLSAWGAQDLAKQNYNFSVQVNWLAMNEEKLRSQFSSLTSSRKQMYKHNPLEIPKRLWHFMLNKLEIAEKQIWNELAKKNKNRLINMLLNDEFEVKGKTTFKEEFVSCGGIDLSEIDMQTMESKRHKGIYFAGELLNIDGVTGGFNFQAAWTTGYLAGKNSAL
ncbi:MAG: NAD(P)/FAD-dependent oxidoreductase [Flavobacteriales bacterium]|jgi:predicted Rossmann fold flavoprotein|nr:NAD(P)/FAD-dependent oxidoreductase [Flavobacteriales bacterium]MBT5090363.1 NAD(P)/FAD-dependent oxidoreductase [Flavobacteriales bacterium]